MPLGTEDPKYDLLLIRIDRETGKANHIRISREALRIYGVEEYEWKEGTEGLLLSSISFVT